MAPRTTTTRDDREGLSPPPLPFGLNDIWDDDDDDDDMEFEPAFEQSEDMSQDDTGEDGESDYMGIVAFPVDSSRREADLGQMREIT
jgi:hypothetical protein